MRMRQSRKITATDEESGRLYRCRVCSFPIDTQRLPGGTGTGMKYSDFVYEEQSIRGSGDPKRVMMIANRQNSLGAVLQSEIMERDSMLPLAYDTPRYSSAISGCPLCGCRSLP